MPAKKRSRTSLRRPSPENSDGSSDDDACSLFNTSSGEEDDHFSSTSSSSSASDDEPRKPLISTRRDRSKVPCRGPRPAPGRIRKSRKPVVSWNYGHIPTLKPLECSLRIDSYKDARCALHLAALPEYLPCRENEFHYLYDFLSEGLTTKLGQCLYISGVPGTGKTATFFSVLRSLRKEVELGQLDGFNFVEVNGMRVIDPNQAYGDLWACVSEGGQAAGERAKDLLRNYYQTPNHTNVTLVLLDELDFLVTQNQNVVYDLTNWAHTKHSHLIVVAIANTMNLPERLLNKKVASRLGRFRLKFQPYTAVQLGDILRSRLGMTDGDGPSFINWDATKYAGLRVSAVNGDARQALELMRRVVGIAERENEAQDHDSDDLVPISVEHVVQAYREMHTSPMTEYLLMGASTLQKVVLGIMVLQQQRTGLKQLSGVEIQEFAHHALCAAPAPEKHKTRTAKHQEQLSEHLESAGLGTGLPDRGVYVIPRVLQQLYDMRFILMEPRTDKVQLNMSEQDILYALKQDELMRSLLSIHHSN